VIYLDYNATTPLVNAIYQLSFLNKKEEDMIWKDLLKKIKVFKDLSSEEINLVEKLVKERVYDAGTKVIKEGEPSTEFFICIDGELIIQINVPGRGAITTRTISDMSIFGWSALTNIPHYGALVVTNKDSKVLVFNGAELKELFEKHPRMGYLVMRNLIDVVSSRLQGIRFGLASCITDYRKT
jgi:CRP-like cAMP-binding protein